MVTTSLWLILTNYQDLNNLQHNTQDTILLCPVRAEFVIYVQYPQYHLTWQLFSWLIEQSWLCGMYVFVDPSSADPELSSRIICV